MNPEIRMTSQELRNKLRLVDQMVTLPALAVILTYITSAVDFRPGELGPMLGAIAIYGVSVVAVMEWLRRRQIAPLARALDAGDGESLSDEVLFQGFGTAIKLPTTAAQTVAGVWLGAGVAVPLMLGVVGHTSWLGFERWSVILVAVICGAVVSAGFLFFLMKSALEDVRERLGLEFQDIDVRAGAVTVLPLATKIQFVVLGAVVTTLLLTVSLAWTRSRDAVDAQAMQWQQRVLNAVVARMGTSTFSEARLDVLPVGSILPHDLDLIVIDEGEDVGEIEIGRARVPADLGPVASSPENFGGSSSLVAGQVVSWRRLPDGRMLVAAIDRADLELGFGAFGTVLALLTLLTSSVAIALGWLLSRDIRRAAEVLQDEADRLASGDLRRLRVWEAEDEMGGLGRAFERMGASLRMTVGGVAHTADRVEAAVADISAVSRSVAVASADQVRRIQQASDLMLEINQQVRGVADSAQALNLSVEESSSSILELGAAGDELNDTATVLSGKVDEVSGSIEQMVRSVKEVGSTSEQLSDAAAETSSSMEEMASAMRAVDNTAEATANISNDVVSLAERGQQRVSQTMSGMEAIRDATDAAEKVIRGLGARTKEIGGILDVIDDVADETNLLALNAAIISAQAGEHGRAFSVVADEIKELADRVLASTKEIGSLIRNVQDESEAAVGAIEAGTQSVAGGVELSAEAGSSLEEITRASRESGTRIGQIVSAVREQTKATSHVVSLMEAVREGVDHISRARTEQDGANEVVYRSAVTMQEVAQQVRRTTEEQSRGFGRIRESIEGVREAVEQINGSLRDQSSACSQVAEFLEQVADGTRSNEDAAQRMGESMRVMMDQAQTLRGDLEKFQI
jgi:methyl-accepting chemotaxis protein